MKQLDKRTDLDIILEHYASGELGELPVKLQITLDRWDYANNLVKNYLVEKADGDKPTSFSMAEIARMIVKKFGVCRSQAYNDINNSQLFYGSVSKGNKEYWRQVLFNTGMEALRWAVLKKDYDKIFKGIEKLSECLGLNKDDSVKDKTLPNLYYMAIQFKNELVTLNLNETHKLDQELIDQICNNIIEEAKLV